MCKVLDDEKHLFFDCLINQNVRDDFIEYYKKIYEDFNNINYIEKLKIILNPEKPEDIDKVVSFIKQSYELRRGDT